MKLYKVTDENGKTHNDMQWAENITHYAIGEGKELCTADVIHAYTDPLLAVFFNPIHGGYDPMLLWKAKGKVVVDDGTKVGCKTLTTINQVPVPVITIEQKIEIAIRCALEVYQEHSFVEWAEAWLSGENRTVAAAYATATHAAPADAATATHAAYAVYAATHAAYAAHTAAYDAAYDAAAYAAYAAAAAAAHAYAPDVINILKIIKEVVGDSNIQTGG